MKHLVKTEGFEIITFSPDSFPAESFALIEDFKLNDRIIEEKYQSTQTSDIKNPGSLETGIFCCPERFDFRSY